MSETIEYTKDNDFIYLCFFTALNAEVKADKWKGQKGILASDSHIAGSSLTAILKGKTKAIYKNREALADTCGFGYFEFIEHGCTLLLKDKPELSKKIKTLSLPPESKPEPKTEAELEAETKPEEESMNDLTALVTELSRENRKMATENKDLAVKVKELEMQLEGIQGAMEHGQIQRPVNE